MRILFEVLARRGLIAVFICAQSDTNNNSLRRQYPTLIDVTDMYPTLTPSQLETVFGDNFT